MTNTKRVCLVTGVGPGTGAALAKRFARDGYQVAMLARDAARLTDLANDIDNAHAYACNMVDAEAIKATVTAIQNDLGAPDVVIHNAYSFVMGNFLDIDASDVERNFRVNTLALLHLAQLTAPAMIEKGHGVILATGNTSAYRGKEGFAGFAPTKAAQRILLESIARSAGPKGIHAAYVAIDAVIDLEWTREAMPDAADDAFCKPADIAEECWRIAHQPKSAWSSESIIRPFGENW